MKAFIFAAGLLVAAQVAFAGDVAVVQGEKAVAPAKPTSTLEVNKEKEVVPAAQAKTVEPVKAVPVTQSQAKTVAPVKPAEPVQKPAVQQGAEVFTPAGRLEQNRIRLTRADRLNRTTAAAVVAATAAK